MSTRLLPHKRDVPTVPIRERKHVDLVVIPESEGEGKTILELKEHGTVFIIGEGPPISYDCGNCRSPLLVDLKPSQVERVLLRCANCGSLNESPS